MWKKIVSGWGVLILMSGCAVGVTHDYLNNTLELPVDTKNAIAVGTLDHRNYVVNSRKNENFVGLSRGGFGNPFDVVTQSGNPLAEDISSSIVASLKQKNVDARVVKLGPTLTTEMAASALRAEGAHRSLLLTLREWKGDTYFNVGLAYDFDVSIFDPNGFILLEKNMQGDENLGSADAFTPGGGAQIKPRFKSLIEELFQDPKVQRTLQ